MKPYGMKRRDRIKCSVKGCKCGDLSSKHPVERNGHDNKNRRLKKSKRSEWKIIKQKICN